MSTDVPRCGRVLCIARRGPSGPANQHQHSQPASRRERHMASMPDARRGPAPATASSAPSAGSGPTPDRTSLDHVAVHMCVHERAHGRRCPYKPCATTARNTRPHARPVHGSLSTGACTPVRPRAPGPRAPEPAGARVIKGTRKPWRGPSLGFHLGRLRRGTGRVGTRTPRLGAPVPRVRSSRRTSSLPPLMRCAEPHLRVQVQVQQQQPPPPPRWGPWVPARFRVTGSSRVVTSPPRLQPCAPQSSSSPPAPPLALALPSLDPPRHRMLSSRCTSTSACLPACCWFGETTALLS